jgi:hypothetical protein
MNLDNNDLQAQLQHLKAQIAHQQQQMQALADKQQATTSKDRVDLHDDIKAAIAPHLQQSPLEDTDRKKVLSRYPKSDAFPKPIKDDNGLAGRAIPQTEKKWVCNHLPSAQKDALDILRVAATGWQAALATPDNGPAQLDTLFTVVRDIVVLATDNAQRLARTQLKQTFELGGAKGAYSLMDLGPDSQALDERDYNILQQAHIESLQELKRYNKTVDEAKGNNNNKSGGRGKGRGGYGNGGGWRSRGGGKGRGGYGNGGGWRSGGSYNNNNSGYGRSGNGKGNNSYNGQSNNNGQNSNG